MPMKDQEEREKAKLRLAELDRFLQTTESIPDNLWWNIGDAIGYDSATPVSWAVGRLKILYLRTENGENISVPAAHAVLNKDTFKDVISDHFSPHTYTWILER